MNVRSALISGLSLCLLLRTNRPELAVLAAVLTIAVGLIARWPAGRIAVRTAGGAIALAGVAFLRGFG